jgi:RimJ/RimL family protein N-acetyltransferase
MREQRFRLRSGDHVLIRPLRREDAPALAAAVKQLSARSRYFRFHAALPRLTEQMVGYLTDIDHYDHEALVAVPDGSDGVIVGVARFIRDPAHPGTAETAIVVSDSWQRRGVGVLLLRRLARRATEVGIRRFTADILAENAPTRALAHRFGAVYVSNDWPTMTVGVDIDQERVADVDAGTLLRALAGAEVSLIPLAQVVMLHVSVELIRRLSLPLSNCLADTASDPTERKG